jgi:putative peptidoglycan lipid II flippase
MKDSRTPMLVSLVSILVNFAAANLWLTYTKLGHAGLALSTSTVILSSVVLQFWILRNRIGGIHGRDLASTFARVALASVFMGVVVAACSVGVQTWLGPTKLAAVASLAVCVFVGVVVFFSLCRALRVPELDLAMSSLPAPLRRVLGASHAILL